MKRSTNTVKLNKILRFNMVNKIFDQFVIFHKFFWQKCAIEIKFGKKNFPTLGTLVSTKKMCIKMMFTGKITLVPVAF